MFGHLPERLDNWLYQDPISGMANCHLPGLYSLVFRPRLSQNVGMVRLFYASSECDMESLFRRDGRDLGFGGGVPIDYVLLPHTHRQDVALTLFFGSVTNYNLHFTEFRLAQDWAYAYEFGSALLNGEFSLRKLGRYAIKNYESQVLTPCQTLLLPAEQAHTVKAKSNSAWFVEEGRQSEAATLCYSKNPDLTLSSEGLYRELGKDELQSIWQHILHEAGVVNEFGDWY